MNAEREVEIRGWLSGDLWPDEFATDELFEAGRILLAALDDARRDAEALAEALDAVLGWQPYLEVGLARLHPQEREAVRAARVVLGGYRAAKGQAGVAA